MLFVSNFTNGSTYPNNSFQGAKKIHKFYMEKIQESPKIREGFDEIETLLDKRISYQKDTQK